MPRRFSVWNGVVAALGNSAFLNWTAPTLDEAGDALTPTTYLIYASRNAQDWDDITALPVVDTGSSATSYTYSNAAFTSGTEWFFWQRGVDGATGAQSEVLPIPGSKIF